MRHQVRVLVGVLAVCAFAGQTDAGTVSIDFDDGVGPLTYLVYGPGVLTASGGRASVTDANVTILADGGSPATSAGTVSTTMTLRPGTDAAEGVGLIMIDVSDGGVYTTAVVDGFGRVVLTDWIGQYAQDQFTYPGALNSMTLEYNPSTARATVYMNGSPEMFREDALFGAVSVFVGVVANGPAGFETFGATGPGIPDYPPLAPDADGDGVSDADELAAGTDENDPGNLPVHNSEGATIHPLNGATVVIPAGSLPEDTVNIAAGTAATVPEGPIPADNYPSDAAMALEPDGLGFSGPVAVTLPYSPSDITGLDDSTLDVFYFAGPDYSASGVSGVTVDTGNRTVSFSTTHFTVFLIAGQGIDSDGDGVADIEDAFPNNRYGATDSDGDGIGDEWEDHWFGDDDDIIEPGDLDTADALSDSDFDGLSDLTEFLYAFAGLDPTDGTSQLPAAGAAACALLMAALAAAGAANTRRRRT